jgi:hypothetical protein
MPIVSHSPGSSKIPNARRLQRSGSFVTRFKGWVKLNDKLPVWPVAVRMGYALPGPEGNDAIAHLETSMEHIFVEPSGECFAAIKPYHHGCWKHHTHVKGSFAAGYDKFYVEGMQSMKFKAHAEKFKAAVQALDEDKGCIDFPFHFVRCHEIR